MLGISQVKMMVVLVQVSIFLSPGAVSPGGDLSQKAEKQFYLNSYLSCSCHTMYSAIIYLDRTKV